MMTKEDKQEVMVIVKEEIDKSINRYHTERIEKMESNIINEIKEVKGELKEVKEDITSMKINIGNLKGQMLWITTLLTLILTAMIIALVKVFLS